MAKEEPLDEALYELKSIIAMLQANLFRMVSVKEVKATEQLLLQIEKAVDKFENKAIGELEGVGLTLEQKDLIEEGKVPETVTGEHREALEIAIELKKKVEEMRHIAHKEQGRFDDEDEELSEEAKKKHKKESRISKVQHKKKFKRLGGDKWKPL